MAHAKCSDFGKERDVTSDFNFIHPLFSTARLRDEEERRREAEHREQERQDVLATMQRVQGERLEAER